jgi:hypothetical protein
VEVVRPKGEEKGDFNDVLKAGAFKDGKDIKDSEKNSGTEEIYRAFKGAVDKHQARTVREYFKAIGEVDLTKVLTKQSMEDLEYIEKYQINQDGIINEYRKSDLRGAVELDNARRH